MSIIHRPRASKPADDYHPSPSIHLLIRDPAVVSTITFDPYYVRRERTEEVLRCTVKRWGWFEQAPKIDPTLGTLTYLPLEIRRRVWEMVLQCRKTLSVDGLWEYDHFNGTPFNLSAYYFGFGRRRFNQDDAVRFRSVSSTIRAEFEDIFLSERTFRFNRPQSLEAFVNHLSSYQLRRLRSFEIGLYVCSTDSMVMWLESMAHLPQGLQEIHFRIYYAPNGWFGPPGIFQGKNYHHGIDQDEFDILNALVKRAIERASQARVTICGAAKDHQLTAECKFAVNAIIANKDQQLTAECKLAVDAVIAKSRQYSYRSTVRIIHP